MLLLTHLPFNTTSTPLIEFSVRLTYLLRLPLSCDWTGGSSLQNCAHVRVTIEEFHLPLLALPLYRDRREGKRNMRRNRRRRNRWTERGMWGKIKQDSKSSYERIRYSRDEQVDATWEQISARPGSIPNGKGLPPMLRKSYTSAKSAVNKFLLWLSWCVRLA